MLFSKERNNYLSFEDIFKISSPTHTDKPYYPGTSERMQPGDVIYSSKGWSTFLAGHAGIVGHDYKMYHSHPQGGFADTLPAYLSRHKFGSTLTVLRPKEGNEEAAEWVMNNVWLVEKYFFDLRLDNVYTNYCTKFIWQAFWHSGCGDITSRNLTINKLAWIYPLGIKEADFFQRKATIVLGRKKVKKAVVT